MSKQKKITLYFMEIEDAEIRHERSLQMVSHMPMAIHLCFEQFRQMLNPSFFHEADSVAMAGIVCMMRNCIELGHDIVLDIDIKRPARYIWILKEMEQAGAVIKKVK